MIHIFIIFEITAIGYIVVIVYIVWGYFKRINAILSNFYGFFIVSNVNHDEYNLYLYQSNIVTICLIKLQRVILILTDKKTQMILVLLDYFSHILISVKKKYHVCTTVAINSYDYDFGLICSLRCTNANCIMDVYNFLDKFYHLCMLHKVDLDEMKKIHNIKIVHDIIAGIRSCDYNFIIKNIMHVALISIFYPHVQSSNVKLCSNEAVVAYNFKKRKTTISIIIVDIVIDTIIIIVVQMMTRTNLLSFALVAFMYYIK